MTPFVWSIRMSRLLSLAAIAGICCCVAPLQRPTIPVLSASPSAPNSTEDRSRISGTDFALLVRTEPLRALDLAIQRYQMEVKGFQATFQKQERIGGKLGSQEIIRVLFRNEPFSVLMKWEAGAGLADGTLYVVGENAGQMEVRTRIGITKSVDPRSSIPRSSARYTIEEFGLVESMKRTQRAWIQAKTEGRFQVEYLGKSAIPELNGRECHVIRRTCPTDSIDPFVAGEKTVVSDQNRSDAFRTVTIYLDCETWLQVGSVLHRNDGQLAGAYFFRDVQLNPVFQAGAFAKSALKNK
jgi:hypothetical protein